MRDNLVRIATEKGMSIDTTHDPVPCDPRSYDVLIVNGEGTLHHNAPRAVSLLKEARRFKDAGVPVFLINSVHQKVDGDFSMFNAVAVRESLSLASVNAAGANAVLIPDLAFCTPWDFQPMKRSGILFVDSMSANYARMIEAVAAEHGQAMTKMCEVDWPIEKWLEVVASSELVVTGRFHAAVFAMLTGTPFFAMPSNTFKTRGMMNDFGVGQNFFVNDEQLRAALNGPRPAPASFSLPSILSKWSAMFDTISGASKCIEESPSLIPRGASVVLVGNGPSIRLANLGRVIDAFDVVMRFNTYTIAGMERHTGERTTIWSTFGQGTKPRDDKSKPESALMVHEHGEPALPVDQIWRVPSSFYAELCAIVRARSKRDDVSKTSPSSGFIAVKWLLHCGVPLIHLVGFDHFKRNRVNLHHYWHGRVLGRPKEHDGDAEAELFADLEAEGRVRYLI